MDTSSKYQRAQARVEEIKEFYNHLGIYLVFVCIFIAVNLYSRGFFWAIFPIVGWGIGVASHAAKTFAWNPFFSKDWEQRKINEFMKNEEL